MGLLLIGLVDVTRTVSIGRDFPTFLDAVLAQSGLGHVTNLAAADVAGWIVIAANVLGLVLAIWFTVPRLRTRRLAFWVPLAAGVTCVIVTMLITVGTAIADPSVSARFGG